MSGIPDFEALPLVTVSHPARNGRTLDVARRAALHNFLVRYGWVGMGRRIEELPSDTFFEKYGTEADEVRDSLHPDLTSFLQSVIVNEESLFVFVIGLQDPSEMFSVDDIMVGVEEDVEEDELNRFVTLYEAGYGWGGARAGMIYDQKHHRVAMSLGLEEIDRLTPVADHQDLWFPLETMLTKWIDMIRVKKVTTAKDPHNREIIMQENIGGNAEESAEHSIEYESDEEISLYDFDPNACTEYKPWIWHSYGHPQVDSTVSSFHRLAEAVEDRMPSFPGSGTTAATTMDSLSPSPALFSDEALDAASVPEDCFIRSFLTKARRPAFTRVAPGLIIPADAEAFARIQRFTYRRARVQGQLDDGDGTIVPPILIFPAADGSATMRALGGDDAPPWPQYYKPGEGGPLAAGLYSEGVERRSVDSAEEGFRLVLPFDLVGEHARTSDGAVVEKGFASLFQHGYKPFGGEWWRAQRMERLFDRWREMVEAGVWTIGPEGVEGDISVFHQAQTVMGWRKYYIAPDW